MDAELLSSNQVVSENLKYLNEMRNIANSYKKMEELNKETNILQTRIEQTNKELSEAEYLELMLNVKRSEYFKAIETFINSVKTYIYLINNNNKKMSLWYLYEINYNGGSNHLFKDIISENTKKDKSENFDGIIVPEEKYYNSERSSDIDKLKHFRQISRQYFKYYAKYIMFCLDNEIEPKMDLVERLMLRKYQKH